MAIRWRRDEPLSRLQRAAGEKRFLRLQDSKTDITYMRVEFRHKTVDKPAGWAYVIYYPPHIGNKVSADRWEREADAHNFAKAWWVKNREKHLADWRK